MVELRTRNREMRGHGENHHEKLGLKRIWCASQLTIPDTAGMSSDPACNHTDMRSSQPNQACRTSDFSYRLVSSTSFSSASPSLSFLSTTLPSSQNTTLTHPSLSLHAMIMSWHRVQAYTKYSIHWVQHRPKIVGLPFSLKITSWPVTVPSASGVPLNMIDCHQPALHGSSKVKSSCHIPMMVARWLTDEYSLSTWHAINWPPPITCSMLLDHSLQVCRKARSIAVSKFAWSWTPKCISKLAHSRPPSSDNHGHHVHVQTRSITASECISKFNQSQPANWLVYHLPARMIIASHVHLQTRSITASKVHLWVHSTIIFRRT